MVAAAIRAALTERLSHRRIKALARHNAPGVDILLLDVDREYRETAAAGKLRKIAPKRFDQICIRVKSDGHAPMAKYRL